MRSRSDFNFAKFSSTEVDSAFGILRTVIALHQGGFEHIRLTKIQQKPGADLVCQWRGNLLCGEVKTLTIKSERERPPHVWLEDQMLNKLRDVLPDARRQLRASKEELKCNHTMLSIVMNWVQHSIILDQDDFLRIANDLDVGHELEDIDLFFFVTKVGGRHLFVTDKVQPGLY